MKTLTKDSFTVKMSYTSKCLEICKRVGSRLLKLVK